MRTISDSVSVRLYHIDYGGEGGAEGGAAVTLFYGPLAEALAIAAVQGEDIQAGLYLATENDVVAYLDLED